METETVETEPMELRSAEVEDGTEEVIRESSPAPSVVVHSLRTAEAAALRAQALSRRTRACRRGRCRQPARTSRL